MSEVRCVDGRLLDVRPVPVRDRLGTPYEVTLRLLLDGSAVGDVGQRCAGLLRSLLDGLDDGGPLPGPAEQGVRAWAHAAGADPDDAWAGLRPHLPRDVELFCLRCRDPDDVPTAGELRAVASVVRTWDDDAGWQARPEVVLQAWGEDGRGVRALLDREAFTAWLTALDAECAAALEPVG